MQKNNPVIHHLIRSLIALGISLGILFLSFFLIQKIFAIPNLYINSDLTLTEAQNYAITLLIIVVSVLIAYIVYLLLTSKTRSELMVWNETRWLAISREQFRRLYEGAPVPYITLDEKGGIREPNKAALRFFNASPQDITEKNFFDFFPDHEQGRAKQIAEQYKLGIPIDRVEIEVITKGGFTRTILLSIFDMNTPGSKGRIGLASLFDITEQKHLDQAKTEFVSLASHQLRAPTVTVKWYMDMLRSGDLGPLAEKQKDYIERIYAVNEDMIDLIDTLLNVSRIEIGTLTIDKKKTNVHELTESVLKELAPQIETKKITVKKNFGNLLTAIESDPKLLRIVIQNLISNSVKYTPDGGTIEVGFADDMNTKRIIVRDTGYGIPKEVQDKVFTKLFRADNVRALSTSQGTGLGLYLVKSIIESMGGHITFISEENKGSEFTITL